LWVVGRRGSWVVGRGWWSWDVVAGCGSWSLVVDVGRGTWVVVGRGSWVVVVGRRSSRSSVVGRGSWVVGRGSWAVVVGRRRRSQWSVVGRGSSFRLSFRRSLRLTRRRVAQLLPLLVDGARLRLTLLHSVTAPAAAAGLRLGSVAPRHLRSLYIRGCAVRGSDLRSRTASRLVLHRCGASGGVAPPRPLHSLSTRWGVARCFGVCPRISLRLVLLRRGRAACRLDSGPRSAGEGGRRTAPTYAAAQRRGSHGCGGAARLLPSLSTREWAARGSNLCWVVRGSDFALAQHRGSCCGASAVGRRGAQATHEVGGVRLRLTPSHVVAAQHCCRRTALTCALGRHSPDLRSCTASRLVLLRRVCGWLTRRGWVVVVGRRSWTRSSVMTRRPRRRRRRRPTTHDPRPRPTTHYPRPTTHDPRPTIHDHDHDHDNEHDHNSDPDPGPHAGSSAEPRRRAMA